MKIGIDFDSTIAKIDQPWLDRFNALRGSKYLPEDWSDWELSFLPPDDRSIFLGLLTPDLYDSVKPYPGAPDAIRRLAKEPGVELMCVTSNPRGQNNAFMRAKEQWLHKYIPELVGSLVAARVKSGLGLDILVDDAPHNHENPDYVAILVRRPWNKKVNCPYVFEDWESGQRLILRLISSLRIGKDLRPL